MAKGSVPERCDTLIQSPTDAWDLRFRDAGVHTEHCDKVVDTAGGHPVHVGLHHHGVERLIDPAARLQHLGEERAPIELRDREATPPSAGQARTLAPHLPNRCLLLMHEHVNRSLEFPRFVRHL